MNRYNNRLHILKKEHESLISRKNKMIFSENGIFERYKYPILTAAHTPLEWRYDLNPETNPYLMERIGVNATMNSGAIKWNGKYLIIVRRRKRPKIILRHCRKSEWHRQLPFLGIPDTFAGHRPK